MIVLYKCSPSEHTHENLNGFEDLSMVSKNHSFPTNDKASSENGNGVPISVMPPRKFIVKTKSEVVFTAKSINTFSLLVSTARTQKSIPKRDKKKGYVTHLGDSFFR